VRARVHARMYTRSPPRCELDRAHARAHAHAVAQDAPSCPSLPQPHDTTCPDSVTATVWWPPHEIMAAPCSTSWSSAAGSRCDVVSPCPRRPNSPQPLHAARRRGGGGIQQWISTHHAFITRTTRRLPRGRARARRTGAAERAQHAGRHARGVPTMSTRGRPRPPCRPRFQLRLNQSKKARA